MIAGSRLHQTHHVGESGGNDPKRGGSQLLGVAGFRHFDLHVDFACSNEPLFSVEEGGHRGIKAEFGPRTHFIEEKKCCIFMCFTRTLGMSTTSNRGRRCTDPLKRAKDGLIKLTKCGET